MKHRLMNRIALALLVISLLAYGVFLVVPVDEELRGWTVWIEAYEYARSKEWLDGHLDSNLLFVGFLTASFLAVTAPFLVGVLRRSRLGWWLVTGVSSLALIGFAATFLLTEEKFPPAVIWLIASQCFNLAGLLFIRRKVEDPPFVPAPMG